MPTESALKDAILELAGDPVEPESMLRRISPPIALGPPARGRLLAPIGASAAVVTAAAVAVAVWQHGPAGNHPQPAGGPGVTVPAPRPGIPTRFAALPRTETALAAKTRDLLGPAATIVVQAGSDSTGTSATTASSPPGRAASATAGPHGDTTPGAAIVGILTIGGRSGGFDLEVNRSTGRRAGCEQWIPCATRTVTGGGSVAFGTVRNPNIPAHAPGATTSDAQYVSADGAVITMHLHSGADGTDALPLQQMVNLVTDNRWFS